MEIKAVPISFGRWKAELVVDGQVLGVGIGQRPACAIRDAINEFCLKWDAMPHKEIFIDIKEWE